jgi:ECF transporter S component (folate family)
MTNKDRLRIITYVGMLIAIGVVLSEILAFSYPTREDTILRFSIGYMPIIIVGLLFGPVYGAIAGGIQDVLGFFLFGGGYFQIGYTLNAVLYGLLPGLLFRRTWKNENKIFYILNYVLAGTFVVAIVWYFFHIDQVVSSRLSDMEKYILAGIALFGSVSLALMNCLMHRKSSTQQTSSKLMFLLTLLYMITSLILTPIWLYIANPALSFWVRLPIRVIKMPIDIALYLVLLPKVLKMMDKVIKKEE